METTDVTEIVDSSRWLLNNGLISDNVKNQLFFCGSIVHRDVQAVDVKIQPDLKLVEYAIYVPSDLMKKITKYNKLSTSKSLLGMWRFKQLLKQEGCLDFQKLLNSFIADYCGPKWSVTVNVINFDTYVDSIEVEREDSRVSRDDKPLNNG